MDCNKALISLDIKLNYVQEPTPWDSSGTMGGGSVVMYDYETGSKHKAIVMAPIK